MTIEEYRQAPRTTELVWEHRVFAQYFSPDDLAMMVRDDGDDQRREEDQLSKVIGIFSC